MTDTKKIQIRCRRSNGDELAALRELLETVQAESKTLREEIDTLAEAIRRNGDAA